MLNIDRVHFNKTKPVSPFSVGVILINEETKENKIFVSITAATDFLKSAGHKAYRRTLISRLGSEKTYYGYRCVKDSTTKSEFMS